MSKRIEKMSEYWNRYSTEELRLMEGATTSPTFWDNVKVQYDLDKKELNALKQNRVNYSDCAALDIQRASRPDLSIDQAEKVTKIAKSEMEMAVMADDLYERQSRRKADRGIAIGGMVISAISAIVSIGLSLKNNIPAPIQVPWKKR